MAGHWKLGVTVQIQLSRFKIVLSLGYYAVSCLLNNTMRYLFNTFPMNVCDVGLKSIL